MSRLIDLTGRRFGRLTVSHRAPDGIQPSGQRSVRWLCECDCGNTAIVRAAHLRDGHTKSCGCWNKDEATRNATTHGMDNTRLYRIYTYMKSRCYNKNRQRYRDYGGRGIAMCDEWKESFEKFFEWSMQNGYNDSLTIDRIDVNKGYYPENCRWANHYDQAHNKRNNHKIEIDGTTKTITEWSREMNISVSSILYRMRNGWNEKDAVITPPSRSVKSR